MAGRRRSLRVGVSVMGLSAMISGCDPPEAPRIYSSVADCSLQHDPGTCASAWQASVGENAAQAPTYGRLDLCEDEYGAGHCQARAGAAGAVFAPLMAGFVLGRIAAQRQDQNQNQNQNSGASGGGYVGHPVFFNAGGGFRTPRVGEGEVLAGRSGGFTVRRGFGDMAGFRGGFGE